MADKISGNEIRERNILEFKGKLFCVLKREHVKPGKGGAFVNVEMKSIDGSTKVNHRFRSDEVVSRAFIEEEGCQYLFRDNQHVTVMNMSDYSQVAVDISLLDDQTKFLIDGMMIKLQKYNGEIIGVVLPDTITAIVEETEPYIKGQTAAASYKPAILNGGMLRVMVPPFIKVGDKIIIRTEDGAYVSRVEA